MSSHSYDSKCPNCNKVMRSCSDNRPFYKVEHTCFGCGFNTVTQSSYLSLDDLNLERYNAEMKALSVLPNQDSGIILND